MKSDGTERVMKASLQKSFVEPLIENVDKSTPKKAESSNIVTCIDIEKKEWRRFKIDSIIEYKIIENKEQINI